MWSNCVRRCDSIGRTVHGFVVSISISHVRSVGHITIRGVYALFVASGSRLRETAAIRTKMRHRADNNQDEIVAALEKIGCTVYKIGRPVDLLVGYRAHNLLLECKGKRGTLTKFQKEFFPSWRGQIRIVRSVDEAIQLVTKSYE